MTSELFDKFLRNYAKTEELIFFETELRKVDIFCTNLRCIHKVYPARFVRCISTHRNEIAIASFGLYPGLVQEKPIFLTNLVFENNLFFDLCVISYRIFRIIQISAQDIRKNACRAPSLNACMRNFCKIFMCGASPCSGD